MNKRMKLLSTITLVTIIGIAGTNYLTNTSKSNQQAANAEVAQENTIFMRYSADYPVTEELEQMFEEADLVAIGTYESFDSTWNMARNPEDVSKEDSEHYVEGHLYNFKIKETLYGEADKKIKLNLRYEEKIDVEDEQGKTYKVKYKDNLFIKPLIGEEYLVFLKKDPNFGNYYGAIEPFQILIDKNGKAELKTKLKNDHSEVNQIIELNESGKSVNIESHLEPLEDKITGKSISDLKSKISELKANKK